MRVLEACKDIPAGARSSCHLRAGGEAVVSTKISEEDRHVGKWVWDEAMGYKGRTASVIDMEQTFDET